MMMQRISVRNLVEFILRSGDIDNRTESGADLEAMLAGGRIHRKIQKAMPESYRAEVQLKALYTEEKEADDASEASNDAGRESLTLLVEGRADGIDRGKEGVTVDEIKGIYAELRSLKEPRPLHLAQAKCYAAILVKNEGLEAVCCQLTYCNLDTEEIRRFQVDFTAAELTAWMEALVGQYFRWARFQAEHREERNRSAATVAFPYAYRKGQKETAVDVFRAIRRERHLFVQAPTGMGKTLAVIYPAVKAVAEELTERIFYLTAKNVTRRVAEEAFRLLRRSGLHFLVCTITAKEKCCRNEVFDCNPDACPFAAGHFDRVNDAAFALLHCGELITEKVIFVYAERFRVCPYELSLDVSSWCDAVIADYNYAFDPRVRLRRFFSEGAMRSNIFLVDEAHNLPERASEMYSAALKKNDILELRKLIKPYGKRLQTALGALSRAMPEAGKAPLVLSALDEKLLTGLQRSFSLLCELLEEKHGFPERKELLPFFFSLRTFLEVTEQLDEHYRIYAVRSAGDVLLKLLCIDPSARLRDCLAFCRSAVFFSATLLPVRYYKELLTGDPEEYAIYAESPFRRERRLLLAAGDVSARYQRRTEEEFQKIAAYIRLAVESRRGNYLCFFPSYEYLNRVRNYLEAESCPFEIEETAVPELPVSELPTPELLVQEPEMSEERRREFLNAFEDTERPHLGLSVMGGVFSEGIDLKAERLIGVIIVGTGLPAINTESELRRAYFDERGENGFDYAYRYPGMNKVLQAAGRLIRTDSDTGVILLLDDRFLTAAQRRLFPREWSDCSSTRLDTAERQLRAFWEREEKADLGGPPF